MIVMSMSSEHSFFHVNVPRFLLRAQIGRHLGHSLSPQLAQVQQPTRPISEYWRL